VTDAGSHALTPDPGGHAPGGGSRGRAPSGSADDRASTADLAPPRGGCGRPRLGHGSRAAGGARMTVAGGAHAMAAVANPGS
jgi:hypothetical protein